MNDTLTYAGVLNVFTCPVCGITYGAPDEFVKAQRRDGGKVYCCRGHELGWDETEAQRLRKRLATAEATATHYRDQAEAAERSRRAIKGHLTRVKRRVAAGVCPCCNRTFKDLGRHMAGQHPDYAGAAE